MENSKKSPRMPRIESLSFASVLIAGLWALYMIGHASPEPSTLAIIGVPSKLGNTIVIAGLNLNDAIGTDVSSLTDFHLTSLRDGVAVGTLGSTRYRQTLRLQETGADSFSSGTVKYAQDNDGVVGDFLVFDYGDPMLEYELLFEQGLESIIEDGSLVSMEDSSMHIMGMPATLYRAQVSGNTLDLRFFTAGGDIQIRDTDVTDQNFVRFVRINGRTVNSQARILATVTSDRVRIDRISYRVVAYSRFGGDMYVPPKRGIRSYVREPGSLINPSFDMIYGGIRGSPGLTTHPSGGGNLFFDPSGGERYNIIFTNIAGQTLKAPFVTLVSGNPTLGNGKQSLVVSEGSSSTNFNIDVGDYFVVTSANDVNGVTNVVVYSGISRSDNGLFFDILGQGRTHVTFDASTGRGSLNVGGFTHDVYVDTGSTDRIVVDQNNDGGFLGTTARIITQGGAQIEPGATSTTLRIARKLFDNPPSSDETTTINFVAEGSKITARVPSQSSVTLKSGSDRINQGMTEYGVKFTLDDRRAPSTLAIDIPRGQRSARVAVGGSSSVGRVSKASQAGAFVVVTMERERFLPTGPQGARSSGGTGVGVQD